MADEEVRFAILRTGRPLMSKILPNKAVQLTGRRLGDVRIGKAELKGPERLLMQAETC